MANNPAVCMMCKADGDLVLLKNCGHISCRTYIEASPASRFVNNKTVSTRLCKINKKLTRPKLQICVKCPMSFKEANTEPYIKPSVQEMSARGDILVPKEVSATKEITLMNESSSSKEVSLPKETAVQTSWGAAEERVVEEILAETESIGKRPSKLNCHVVHLLI